MPGTTRDSHLAHELRTPLAVVLGSAETLLIEGATLGSDDRQRLLTALYVNAEVLRSRIEEQVLA